jgi:acylphosphatase
VIAKRFLVFGRVQGVGFRYFVVRQAEALGLSGWVRNLPDGNVEALAAGEEGAIEAFEGRLWSGPPRAQVSEVVGSDTEAAHWRGFRVLPTPWS